MYLSISQAPNESEVETDFAHPSYHHHMNSYLWFPLQSMFSSVHSRPPNVSCQEPGALSLSSSFLYPGCCRVPVWCVWSRFSRVRLFARTVARQAPLSMGFSRQEYWSGVPCPPPGDLPDPESLCLLHWQAGLYHKRHLGSPIRSQNLPLKYILIYNSLSPPPLGGSSTVSCPDKSKSLPSGFPLPTQHLERRPKPDHFTTMLKMLHRRPTAVGCNPESYRWWKQSVHDLQ